MYFVFWFQSLEKAFSAAVMPFAIRFFCLALKDLPHRGKEQLPSSQPTGSCNSEIANIAFSARISPRIHPVVYPGRLVIVRDRSKRRKDRRADRGRRHPRRMQFISAPCNVYGTKHSILRQQNWRERNRDETGTQSFLNSSSGQRVLLRVRGRRRQVEQRLLLPGVGRKPGMEQFNQSHSCP